MIAQKRGSVSNLYSPSQLDFIRQFAGVPARTADPSVLYTQQDVRVLADSMLKEAGLSVASGAQADRLTKEAEEKQAAAIWKLKLLAKPTKALFALAAKRIAPAYRSVTDPTGMSHATTALSSTLDSSVSRSISRDSLLRMIGGYHVDPKKALEAAKHEWDKRGTLRGLEVGKSVPVTEIPYDLKTTAFRGIDRGAYGQARGEWLNNNRLYHTAPKDMPVFYGSKPEIAGAYLNRNAAAHPLLKKGQNFVAEVDIRHLKPTLQNQHSVVEPRFRGVPWMASGNFGGTTGLKRPPAAQIEAYLAAKREPERAYELMARGNNVPVRAVYRVDGRRPDHYPLSREAAQRIRDAGVYRYPVDTGLMLQKIEPSESMADAVRRNISFLQKFDFPD